MPRRLLSCRQNQHIPLQWMAAASLCARQYVYIIRQVTFLLTRSPVVCSQIELLVRATMEQRCPPQVRRWQFCHATSNCWSTITTQVTNIHTHTLTNTQNQCSRNYPAMQLHLRSHIRNVRIGESIQTAATRATGILYNWISVGTKKERRTRRRRRIHLRASLLCPQPVNNI